MKKKKSTVLTFSNTILPQQSRFQRRHWRRETFDFANITWQQIILAWMCIAIWFPSWRPTERSKTKWGKCFKRRRRSNKKQRWRVSSETKSATGAEEVFRKKDFTTLGFFLKKISPQHASPYFWGQSDDEGVSGAIAAPMGNRMAVKKKQKKKY